MKLKTSVKTVREGKSHPSCPIYISDLSAVEKSCLETPDTTSRITRAVLDCSEAGRSSPLRGNRLHFDLTYFERRARSFVVNLFLKEKYST